MARQTIGRGAVANDGTGDSLRVGAEKINANFAEVYGALGNGETLAILGDSLDNEFIGLRAGYQPPTWTGTFKKVFDSVDLPASAMTYKTVPQQIFRMPTGQIGMLLQVREGDPMIYRAALLLSDNGIDWKLSGQFPFGGDNPFAWQGTRFMPQAIVYDEANHRWLMFGSGGEGATDFTPHEGGIRSVGVAISTDNMRTWVVQENPVFTIAKADVLDWAPEGTDSIYLRGVIFKDGLWHWYVSAGARETSTFHYGCLTSETPLGVLSGGAWNPLMTANVNEFSQPIPYHGKIWTAKLAANRRDFQLFTQDTPTGEMTAASGVLTVTVNAEGAGLWRVNGGWIVYSGLRLSRSAGNFSEVRAYFPGVDARVLDDVAPFDPGGITLTPVASDDFAGATEANITSLSEYFLLRNFTSGVIKREDGEARIVSAGGAYVARSETLSDDQYARVTVTTWGTSSSSNGAALVLRGTAGTDYYFFLFRKNGTWEFSVRIGGTSTVLQSGAYTADPLPKTFEFIAIGTRFIGRIDGVAAFDTTDATAGANTGGSAGFMIEGASAAADDLSVGNAALE